jgi:PPOX class probable F420-dependent enzyme
VDDDLVAQMGAEKFVSLTTFKRDGSPVSAPMWIARDGHHLVAWTPTDAWKVKRVRRDPRVELTPCGRSGKVQPGAPVLRGTAEVVTDGSYVAKTAARIQEKYGIQFRVVTLLEAVLARGRKPRVALRITGGSITN